MLKFFFQNSVQKIQISLKSENNRYVCRYIKISRCILLRMRDFFQIQVVQKVEKHISSAKACFENRTFYEKTSKNMVEPERPQITIRRMRCVCWISETTRAHAQAHVSAQDTHNQTCTRVCTQARTHTNKYEIRIAFPLQQWFRERASMLRYTYIACLVNT
jgi:hypothetical protein